MERKLVNRYDAERTAEQAKQKSQRAYHAKQRGSWYGLNPVTRTVPNQKAYDRNKAKIFCRRDFIYD